MQSSVVRCALSLVQSVLAVSALGLIMSTEGRTAESAARLPAPHTPQEVGECLSNGLASASEEEGPQAGNAGTPVRARADPALEAGAAKFAEIRRNIAAITEDFEQDLVAKNKGRWGPSCTLSDSMCGAAAPKLVSVLSQRFGIKAEVVSCTAHVYVRIRNYFGPGKHLILDPTIRQFFGGQKAPAHIPKIFIGTASEFAELVRSLEPATRKPYLSEETTIIHGGSVERFIGDYLMPEVESALTDMAIRYPDMY